MKSFLILSLIASTAVAQQVNMIWASTGASSPTCRSCLDETFQSCPGNYQEVSYARCMCYGDGSANAVTCSSTCDGAAPGMNLASQVAGAWYRYCTLFFKEFCPGAQEFMNPDSFEERCGPNSGPGLGDSAVTASIETVASTATTEKASATTEKASTASGKAAVTAASSSAGTLTSSRSSPTTSVAPAATSTNSSPGRWDRFNLEIMGFAIVIAGRNVW